MYSDQRLIDTITSPEPQPLTGFPMISDSLRKQWNSPTSRNFLSLKIGLVVIFFAVLITNASVRIFPQPDQVDCITDLFQDWTIPINTYLSGNTTARHALIAFASFLIDFNMGALILRWIYYPKSLRLLITILPFYLFRAFTQKIFFEKFPGTYIFDYPEFPALVVPYSRTNDFFFSGHLGITTFCLLEAIRDRSTLLTVTAGFAVPFEFFTLLVTRKHHFVDMPVGMITAHLFFLFGIWLDHRVKDSSRGSRYFRSVDKFNPHKGSFEL